MKNQIKNKARIEEVREIHENNAQIIQYQIGEDDYWNLFLDTGLMFLKNFYTKGDKYYCHLRASSNFWNWFNSEFKLWEIDLVDFLKENKLKPLEVKMEFLKMAFDGELEDSFRMNYLKLFKVVI